VSFILLAAPYSVRAHPGAQLAKMLLQGIVVGVGLLGAVLTLAGALLSFMGVLFIVAVQWSRGAGGPGGAVVVVIMAIVYFLCPLVIYCYCCQGVVRCVNAP
jgi:hypothetical protein